MRKYAIGLFIIFLLGLDVISKYYFEIILQPLEFVPVIWDYLWFQISYNTGIAFSLPIQWVPLKIITLGILISIIFLYIKEEYPKKSRLLDIWYVFIFSGALSHTYERIFVWHVLDFIVVKYFAILNFADIFISVGAIFLVIAYGINKRTSSRPRS